MAISQLTDVLTRSANIAGPTRTKIGPPAERVRNEDINLAERVNKKAYWQWKKGGKPCEACHPLVIARKKAKSELRRAIRVEQARKRENKRSKIMDNHSSDPKVFSRIIAQGRTTTSQIPTEIVSNETVYAGDSEVLTGWTEHFGKLATPMDNDSFDNDYYKQVQDDVDNIVDICMTSENEIPPFTVQEVSEAVSTLNTGKAPDFYGLTVEHIKYAGIVVVLVLVNILNSIIRLDIVPDCIKVGLVTPVYKRKGDRSATSNYRGITVMPVVSKILEVLLLDKLRVITNPTQNRLQRGFTSGSSPLNCSLLLQEVILDAKQQKKRVYIAYLDAKSAFDVVAHPSLLRKLFVGGVDGRLWSILSQLHENALSAVKWQGQYSATFPVQQGVRQGGILSTELYKVYVNTLLDRLQESGLGYKIGTTSIPASACADDVALAADTPGELQTLIHMSVDYSRMERFILQPVKSVAMIISPSTVPTEQDDIQWELGDNAMPTVDKTAHVGILRSNTAATATVIQDNIVKGRRATYSLMSAGLHGRNGLDPQTVCHIILLYILPIFLYGLEILLPSHNELQSLERHFRKLLKQVFSLPNNCADSAIYIISGFAPLEMEVHRRALILYGTICRDEKCIERELLERQLSMRNNSSWFQQVRNLLAKYVLPSPHDILRDPPSKESWKRLVNKRVKNYWKDGIISLASLTSSTRHLCAEGYYPGVRHSAITSVSPSPQDIKRVHLKLKILTGTYILQCNRAAFNQYGVDPLCLMCRSSDETLEHFLLHCPNLQEARTPTLSLLYQSVDAACGPGFTNTLSSVSRIQLVLDCNVLICSGVLPRLPCDTVCDIEAISRRLCFRLHAARSRLLQLLSKQ